MGRLNQRQSFLVSAIVHLVVLMTLASHNGPLASEAKKAEPKPEDVRNRVVFLPPAPTLREMAPPQRVPRRAPPPPQQLLPTPPTPPPSEKKKDKISIGSEEGKKPLILRKDEQVVAAKGKQDAGPSAPPSPVTASTASSQSSSGGAKEVPGTSGLKLPPGVSGLGPPPGTEGSRQRPGDPGPSIADSLRTIDRRVREAGQHGIPTGVGQQMGPLFFDPEGADFTAWINRFREEVYRNWIVPQPALLGFRGHVDIEFTVERAGGAPVNVRILKSSGTTALDRAAENALRSSQLLPLPSDFGPPRVTMQVGFYYNEGPQGS